MAVHQWIEEYRVGVVESIQESGGKGTKALKICQVDCGGDTPLTVVTSAPNVRLKSRLAVAPVGSTVLATSGESLLITKSSVGGVMSEGMFCDAKMLAWDGGSVGIAAQIDASVPIGAPPPLHKPRPQHNQSSSQEVLMESQVEGLFEKKLTKEEKKAAAKLAREAKKVAKEAKKAAEES